MFLRRNFSVLFIFFSLLFLRGYAGLFKLNDELQRELSAVMLSGSFDDKVSFVDKVFSMVPEEKLVFSAIDSFDKKFKSFIRIVLAASADDPDFLSYFLGKIVSARIQIDSVKHTPLTYAISKSPKHVRYLRELLPFALVSAVENRSKPYPKFFAVIFDGERGIFAPAVKETKKILNEPPVIMMLRLASREDMRDTVKEFIEFVVDFVDAINRLCPDDRFVVKGLALEVVKYAFAPSLKKDDTVKAFSPALYAIKLEKIGAVQLFKYLLMLSMNKLFGGNFSSSSKISVAKKIVKFSFAGYEDFDEKASYSVVTYIISKVAEKSALEKLYDIVFSVLDFLVSVSDQLSREQMEKLVEALYGNLFSGHKYCSAKYSLFIFLVNEAKDERADTELVVDFLSRMFSEIDLLKASSELKRFAVNTILNAVFLSLKSRPIDGIYLLMAYAFEHQDRTRIVPNLLEAVLSVMSRVIDLKSLNDYQKYGLISFIIEVVFGYYYFGTKQYPLVTNFFCSKSYDIAELYLLEDLLKKVVDFIAHLKLSKFEKSGISLENTFHKFPHVPQYLLLEGFLKMFFGESSEGKDRYSFMAFFVKNCFSSSTVEGLRKIVTDLFRTISGMRFYGATNEENSAMVKTLKETLFELIFGESFVNDKLYRDSVSFANLLDGRGDGLSGYSRADFLTDLKSELKKLL